MAVEGLFAVPDSIEVQPGGAHGDWYKVYWSCPSDSCYFRRDFRDPGAGWNDPSGPSAEAQAHRFAIRLHLEGCPHDVWFVDEPEWEDWQEAIGRVRRVC